MITTYTYLDTPHSKLHKFVMAFFDRIEFETGDFDTTFYEKEFYDNLVSRHRKILGAAFNAIYEEVKTWNQVQRTRLCNGIRKSNDIKSICSGKEKPVRSADIPAKIRTPLHNLFIKLYSDVLMGKFFKASYGNRLSHYHEFKKHGKNNCEFCPVCGIVEMKTYETDTADQYDHYLPKDIYPFSSINFENLVPICTDCNSFEVKGANDILSHSGVVFYPFDENRQNIEVEVKIEKDNATLDKIEWKVNYTCAGDSANELKAWKNIYRIEARHINHVKGRITKWFGNYYEYCNNKELINILPEMKNRSDSYLISIKNRKVLEVKAIETLVNSLNNRSMEEAKAYSRF